MDHLQTSTKQHLGHNLLGVITEFDLDLYVTLTVKIKLLNLAKIAIPLSIMGQDLLGSQTEFDLNLYVALTIKAKLFN